MKIPIEKIQLAIPPKLRSIENSDREPGWGRASGQAGPEVLAPVETFVYGKTPSHAVKLRRLCMDRCSRRKDQWGELADISEVIPYV